MCGSFNHGCDIIHPAVFGKKYIRLMAGIFLMIFIFTGCGNHTTSKKTSKKEIDYDLVKMKYMQQFIRLMGIINIAD